jgi:sec-independent protein translocase protein TatC
MEREKITSFLADLRRVVLRSLGVVVISGIISFFYAKDIIKLFLKAANLQVYYLSLPEVFFTTVELALYGGVFFAFPFIIYLAWHELKGVLGIKPIYGYLFVFFAVVLFYGGSFFCYQFVLPSGIKFLLSYEGGTIRAMISVERFVLFCTAMIFAFGVTFEIPIIMMALGKIGIIKSRSLSKTRRYAILVVTIAAALITPTPDVYNMILLAVPMYILYEAGIILMKIVEKKDIAEERAKE